MIINGKEVVNNFRSSSKIQDRINNVSQLPDSAKVEVTKKDKKELVDLNLGLNDECNGYGIQNNTLLTGINSKENRKDYYQTYQEMSDSNFIHRALSVIADDCSQRNQDGHTVKVYSDDDEIKETLTNLFERLNMDRDLWSIVYETCKLGDNFYEVIPDSYDHPSMVARLRYLEPERVNRIEKNGKLAFYTYIADTADPEQSAFQLNDKKEDQKVIYKLEPWQIIHFRINDKDCYPYGGSLLKPGVKCFRRLSLLEDSVIIYRLARASEKRVFKIDVGNLPSSEANRQVQKIRDNYRTTQILDDRGNINRTASALALTQDIFIPVREGSSGTSVDTLQGGTALQSIDDIRYFRDQILWTMNVPPEYLGFLSEGQGGSQGRGSLAMQDIKFSRFCERIQFFINEGLTKVASIELFFKHKKKADLKNFRIELTPSSNIKETMDIEFLNQKMGLISAMIGTQLFPKKFILQYVMKLSKKEINDLLFFKDLEAQPAGGADMGMGGMPMGGGMDMSSPSPDMSSGAGMEAAPAPEASPTPASVSTESIDPEKMVRLFGKDVLIEHKEDFVKLMKAMEEYNESKNKPEEKVIEEDYEKFEESDFARLLAESMGNKTVKTTNENSTCLLVENELGGLDFESNSFATFSSKKRTGPAVNGNNLIYEEKFKKFNY